MEFFSPGNKDLHNEIEQLRRQKSALNLKSNSVDYEKQIGIVGDYPVTLYDCSCIDFARRGKPCKHMYRLAVDLGVYKISEKVSDKSIIATEIVKVEKDKEFFLPDKLSLHNMPEQLVRQKNLSSVSITKLDREMRTGIANEKFRDAAGNKYTLKYFVTLNKCNCDDFKQRRLPCKHIYKLAVELGENLYSYDYERSEKLVADFSKGYADGWCFAVRTCNYPELDIEFHLKLAEGEKRGKDSKKEMTLTQGRVYNFSRGSIFYDDCSAYKLRWEDALKKISAAVQVESVFPSKSDVKVIYTNEGFKYVASAVYGTVDFSFWVPNDERTKLQKVSEYSCRQDEFLNLLKSGRFTDLKGEFREIFKDKPKNFSLFAD